MVQIIRKVLFALSISFIVVTVSTFTIAQIIPLEFASYKIQDTFYDVIIFGLPFAILTTITGTIKKKNTTKKNWIFAISTILISMGCFAARLFLIFWFGFGAWTTTTSIYKHKTKNTQIKEQLYDIGAFGYGGKRIAKISPVLKYWVRATPIDTSTINKEDWILVNKQGDIKFP